MTPEITPIKKIVRINRSNTLEIKDIISPNKRHLGKTKKGTCGAL
jgi:hypothetical protein